MELETGLQAYRQFMAGGGSMDGTVWKGKGRWADGQLFRGRIRFEWDGKALRSRTRATVGESKVGWTSAYDEESDPPIAKWKSRSDTGARAQGELSEYSEDPLQFTWDIVTWREDPKKGQRLKEIVRMKSEDSLGLTIEKNVDGRWQPLLETTLHRKTD